jgi:hypothetical protein
LAHSVPGYLAIACAGAQPTPTSKSNDFIC